MYFKNLNLKPKDNLDVESRTVKKIWKIFCKRESVDHQAGFWNSSTIK